MLISIKIWLGFLGLILVINSLIGVLVARSWEQKSDNFVMPFKKAA